MTTVQNPIAIVAASTAARNQNRSLSPERRYPPRLWRGTLRSMADTPSDPGNLIDRRSYAYRLGYLEQMVIWALNDDREEHPADRLYGLAIAWDEYQRAHYAQ